jgi:toxin ParE1/3/4
MPTVRRTSQAELDLLEIGSRIAADNPLAADRWLDLLEQKCQLLATMPELGRRRDELAAQLRSLAVGEYVLFYLPQTDGVEIIRVLHGARDLPPLLE